ncbi:hypothetical protein D3C71_1247280 [compost metagenome]
MVQLSLLQELGAGVEDLEAILFHSSQHEGDTYFNRVTTILTVWGRWVAEGFHHNVQSEVLLEDLDELTTGPSSITLEGVMGDNYRDLSAALTPDGSSQHGEGFTSLAILIVQVELVVLVIPSNAGHTVRVVHTKVDADDAHPVLRDLEGFTHDLIFSNREHNTRTESRLSRHAHRSFRLGVDRHELLLHLIVQVRGVFP